MILQPLTFVFKFQKPLKRINTFERKTFGSKGPPKIKIKNRPTLNVYISASDSLKKKWCYVSHSFKLTDIDTLNKQLHQFKIAKNQ